MARRKDFRRNYENLYPGIEKYPDVLSYGQYILGKPANGIGDRAIYQPTP